MLSRILVDGRHEHTKGNIPESTDFLCHYLQIPWMINFTFLKYHRHCFTGTYEELLEWRSLPHVRFGVTWKTVIDRASADSVARMETKEILLETDAPFLPPYPECKINHPWNLEVVAQEVSRLRNVPLSMLMTAIKQKTDMWKRPPLQKLLIRPGKAVAVILQVC
jgi:hypothetical protein